MNSKIKAGLAAFVVLFVFNFAGAQDQGGMPKALTDLMQLLGKWEGAATLTVEGKTYQFTYYGDFKKTADGAGLYMEEWFTAPGFGDMKGSNLIGYNANDGKIHWFSVDNLGTTHDHLGAWKSPNHFFMQANEMQGKKKFIEKIDLTFKDSDTMDLLLIATLDGKQTEKGVVTFHRVK